MWGPVFSLDKLTRMTVAPDSLFNHGRFADLVPSLTVVVTVPSWSCSEERVRRVIQHCALIVHEPPWPPPEGPPTSPRHPLHRWRPEPPSICCCTARVGPGLYSSRPLTVESCGGVPTITKDQKEPQTESHLVVLRPGIGTLTSTSPIRVVCTLRPSRTHVSPSSSSPSLP